MKNKLLKRILVTALCATLTVGSLQTVAFAQEVEEGQEAEADENAEADGEAVDADGEMLDAEAVSDEEAGEASESAVTMSGIASNNGRVIAATFPESIVPSGFHKGTCTYQDQTIEIARMDNDATGTVVLAYLADADGSNGDFYLCDNYTAEMTDFIQLTNGNKGYIVVLDPGDVVVAPSGFTRAKLQFGSKSATVWQLPGVNKNASDSDKEARFSNPFAPVEVYAASAGAGAIGESAGNDDYAEQPAQEEPADAQDEAPATAASREDAEDGSNVVASSPSEFFLVYAIDNTGIMGFYLYDTVQQTYQRYVEVEGTDNAVISQYKKSASVRLIIIAVLAVLLLIMVFVVINLIMRNRDDDYDYDDDDDDDDDGDDEIDNVRRRVAGSAAKRRELNYLMDIEDEEGDDYDVEEEYSKPRRIKISQPETEERPVRRTRVVRDEYQEEVRATSRKADYDDDGYDDEPKPRRRIARPVEDDEMEITPRQMRQTERARAGRRKNVQADIDDDFDFEFIDIN